jgi:hypothetical protein
LLKALRYHFPSIRTRATKVTGADTKVDTGADTGADTGVGDIVLKTLMNWVSIRILTLRNKFQFLYFAC